MYGGHKMGHGFPQGGTNARRIGIRELLKLPTDFELDSTVPVSVNQDLAPPA
jgi:hypothetical protein